MSESDKAAMAMSGSFLPRIYTVGHSNHQIEAFLKLISTHRIQELVDVRSIPSSGRFPQFKKRNLEQVCARRRVAYRHCPALGNKGVDGGIGALLKLPEGSAAIEELVAAARKATPCGGATAFMCAEADWRDCHRQVIAQQLLHQHGIVTTHIGRDGSLEPHPTGHVLPTHYGIAASSSCVDECCAPRSEAGYAGDQGDDLELAFQLSLQDGKPPSVSAEGLSSKLHEASAPKSEGPTPAEPEASCVQTQPPITRRWGKKR